ncbi:MAG: hypothetical protein J7L32_03630 [Thermoplasmata archaeon]|nr:hypothetical protein [Thermoplasmata archaeon]
MSMQLFRLSSERITCPLVPDVIGLGRKIGEKTGIISTRYGNRMLSLKSSMFLDEIVEDFFVEIVDYDPVKNILVFIGEQQPENALSLAIHWLILRVRNDTNVIVHLYGGNDVVNPLEKTKRILGTIKAEDNMFKEGEEAMFLGKDFADVLKTVEGEM